MTSQEGLSEMVRHFDASKAKGIDATVQMKLTGSDGGEYHIMIKDGAAKLVTGHADHPNATVEVASKDWMDILAGTLDSTAAFMNGKLRVSGDLGLMMRFQSMFVAGLATR